MTSALLQTRAILSMLGDILQILCLVGSSESLFTVDAVNTPNYSKGGIDLYFLFSASLCNPSGILQLYSLNRSLCFYEQVVHVQKENVKLADGSSTAHSSSIFAYFPSSFSCASSPTLMPAVVPLVVPLKRNSSFSS